MTRLSLDRFELHDDQRSNQKVQPMKPNRTAAIQNRHGQLSLEANALVLLALLLVLFVPAFLPSSEVIVG